MINTKLNRVIRDIPDFPKEGIIFKDITPIMQDPELSREVVQAIVELNKDIKIDAVAGIESRGFLFGLALAMELDVPFVTVRKKGKLPYKTISHTYDLEYGTATIEVHEDAIRPGMNVLIHDDLLATGGTAVAAAELMKKLGGHVAGFSFIIELSFLNGSKNLSPYSKNITNLVAY